MTLLLCPLEWCKHNTEQSGKHFCNRVIVEQFFSWDKNKQPRPPTNGGLVCNGYESIVTFRNKETGKFECGCPDKNPTLRQKYDQTFCLKCKVICRNFDEGE